MPVYPKAPAGGLPTMEFFVPCTHGTTQGTIGEFAMYNLAASGNSAYVVFKAPHDFTAIVSAEFIIIGRVTNADIDYGVDTDYGAVGQAYTAHQESTGVLNMAVVLNQIMAIDISGVLSALAADDYVGVRLYSQDAFDVFAYALGVRFRYS